MATERWIGGSGFGFTWTDVVGTALNSLPNLDAVIGGVSIANQTPLDMFADISIVLSSVAFAAPNTIGVYLYPLSDDGTHYGDGAYGTPASPTQASGPPPATYFVGNIIVDPTTAAQYGQLTGIIIPPGTFAFVFYNNAGIVLAASGNTCKCRTYNRQVS